MKIKDFIIKIWIYLSTVTVFFIIFSIIYFVVSKGIKEINLSFLTENPKGMPLGSEGGIKNAIMGSVFLMFLAIVFSIILGTGCAIYSTVYCNSKKINMAIRLVIQLYLICPFHNYRTFCIRFFHSDIEYSKKHAYCRNFTWNYGFSFCGTAKIGRASCRERV